MFIVAVTDKPQEQEARNTTTATATATSNGRPQVMTPAKRCSEEEEAGTSSTVFKPSTKKRKREERVQHAQVFKEFADFSKNMQTKLLEVATERSALLKQMLEKMYFHFECTCIQRIVQVGQYVHFFEEYIHNLYIK